MPPGPESRRNATLLIRLPAPADLDATIADTGHARSPLACPIHEVDDLAVTTLRDRGGGGWCRDETQRLGASEIERWIAACDRVDQPRPGAQPGPAPPQSRARRSGPRARRGSAPDLLWEVMLGVALGLLVVGLGIACAGIAATQALRPGYQNIAPAATSTE